MAIEEPFSILALEVISNTALTNVRELQAMHGKSQGASGEAELPVAASDMVALAMLGSKRGLVDEELLLSSGR